MVRLNPNRTTSYEPNIEVDSISKLRALEIFDTDLLDSPEAGTFSHLSAIHKYIFADLYDFAGTLRTVNIAKGNFSFANALYLGEIVEHISKMPQSNFNEIIEKYVEMNIAHPFREGNGRSMRIWLDAMLKAELGMVISWSRISKEDYFEAMLKSPVDDLALKTLLENALTKTTDDRETFVKSIEVSWYYEKE